MIINFYVIFFILFILFFIIPTTSMLFIKNNFTLKIISYFILFLYSIIVFLGTIVELESIYPVFEFSFDFSYKWFSTYFCFGNLSLDNLFINIFLMFPIGFFIYSNLKKSQFKRTIILSMLLSITIEIYQTILPVYRNTELLDIFLNGLSGLFSAIFFKFIEKMRLKLNFRATNN